MNTAFTVIMLFFGIYGFVHMIMHGIGAFRTEKGAECMVSHRAVLIHNGAEHAEGVLRSLAWQEIPEEIIAVDLGSSDETSEILEYLDKEYSFLTVMSEAEYLEFLHEQKELLLFESDTDC